MFSSGSIVVLPSARKARACQAGEGGCASGTWSNFGDYRGDKIAVSSIDRGLFVLEPRLGKNGS